MMEVPFGMCLMWLSLTERVQLPQVQGPERFLLLSSLSWQLQRLLSPNQKPQERIQPRENSEATCRAHV